VRVHVVLPPAYLKLTNNAQRVAYKAAHPQQFVPVPVSSTNGG
jgi:hypothetical protein